MIGRQIASLDLLSNGRAELAFGPVESLNEVEALDEAIDIVRAILDVSEPGTVALDGRHFPIMGAQRGPLPQHTIPIWLSGSALPLLELAGRTRGWLDRHAGRASAGECGARCQRDRRRARSERDQPHRRGPGR